MKKTYRGACHCRAVQFEIDAVIDHVRACNCSICAMRGALAVRVPNQDFRLLTPIDRLSVYKWGSRTAEDYFCSVCGVLPFRKPSALTAAEIAAGRREFDGWSVNARCLEGLDLDALPISRINGLALELE